MAPLKLKSGHTVEEAGEEESKEFLKLFPLFDGIVRLVPNKWFYPSTFPAILEQIHEFEFKPSDIFVITQPKSGTTWMQEIVWTLVHNPDLSNPLANHSIDLRSPHMEVNMLLNNKKVPKLTEDSEAVKYIKSQDPTANLEENIALPLLKSMKKTRVIKTHMPLELFPKTAFETSKIIYMTRDPRDVIVSKYHFFRQWLPFSFQGTLSDFLDLFLQEKQFHQPYWPHVKQAYDQREKSNLLFLYFEDMKENPEREITKISQFLNLDRTEKHIQNVVSHTNFLNMKKRSEEGVTDEPMSDGGRYVRKLDDGNSGFFRKGKSGNWKDSFTPDEVARITKWMDDNMKMFPDDFKYKTKV